MVGRIPPGPLKIAASDGWALVGIDMQGITTLSTSHRLWLRKALAGLGFYHEAKNLRRDGKQIHAYVRRDAAEASWWSPAW